MLLRNESRVRHSIDIKLIFDGDRKREITIQECDNVQVSYRKNGCIKCGVGVITKIEPYKYVKNKRCCEQTSAIITVDMSEDYVACTQKIDLFDIIDIRKVKCECVCHCPNKEETTPDFSVKPEMLVGTLLTDKEVIIRE